MYDSKAVRRRRLSLAGCVVLSVVLLTLYFGEGVGGGLHAIQRGAQEVLSPLQTGASRAFKPVRDLAGWSGDTIRARRENESLRVELTELRRELAQTRTSRRDARQLRRFERLAAQSSFPSGTTPVTARVIVRSPTVWFSSIRIDKGSDDGIDIDHPVVTGDGLVGKVSSVNSGTATVRLITDGQSAVSAQIVPGGANGVVEPRVGKPDDLLLEYVEKGARVRKGSTVVTSGTTTGRLGSLFPRGIPIGRVKPVDEEELEIDQRVHLEPFAELRGMDFVQVLVRPARGQRVQAVGS